MSRLLTCLTIAVVSFFAISPARADVFGIATLVAPPFVADADAQTLTGSWVAYQLDVMTDDGANITAIDVSQAAARGIFGTFHQQQLLFPAPADTPSGDPATAKSDTHLTPLTGALTGEASAEDNNGTNASNMVDNAFFNYGTGTFLTGAWGIPGASQSDTAKLAYIVIPTGSESSLNIIGSIATSTGTFSLDEMDFDFGGDPNGPANTPPTVDDLFPGEAGFDQHTLATLTNPASYQMQGTDAEDGDDANLDWTLNTFTGPFSNGGNPLPGSSNGNQMLSPTGLFTWDPTGSGRGYYFAGVTVMDSGGLMDTGILRVQVPEPGAFVLAGLSLIGVFASRRRLS